jgi:hypothetical protein
VVANGLNVYFKPLHVAFVLNGRFVLDSFYLPYCCHVRGALVEYDRTVIRFSGLHSVCHNGCCMFIIIFIV